MVSMKAYKSQDADHTGRESANKRHLLKVWACAVWHAAAGRCRACYGCCGAAAARVRQPKCARIQAVLSQDSWTLTAAECVCASCGVFAAHR